MAKYAQHTKVPVDRSRNEIEATLARYGATQFVYGHDEKRAVIGFSMSERTIRFDLPIEGLSEKEERQRWRALALVIKSKLESIECSIEEFDEAFLAQIVLPNGSRVGQWGSPQIAAAYKTGQMPKLLLAGPEAVT